MKLALVMLFSIGGFVFGADPKPKTTETPAGEVRRLDSVTWDLKTHTLSWVVQHGKVEDGEFVPTTSHRYQITPDDASMADATDHRQVDADEAKLLHELLDTLSIYCARSVVWWEHPDATTEPDSSSPSPSLKPDHPNKPNEDPAPKPVESKPVKAQAQRVGELQPR
jgi:hypothetical protein